MGIYDMDAAENHEIQMITKIKDKTGPSVQWVSRYRNLAAETCPGSYQWPFPWNGEMNYRKMANSRLSVKIACPVMTYAKCMTKDKHSRNAILWVSKNSHWWGISEDFTGGACMSQDWQCMLKLLRCKRNTR